MVSSAFHAQTLKRAQDEEGRGKPKWQTRQGTYAESEKEDAAALSDDHARFGWRAHSVGSPGSLRAGAAGLRLGAGGWGVACQESSAAGQREDRGAQRRWKEGEGVACSPPIGAKTR